MQKFCTVSRILIPFVQSDWYDEIFMRVFFLCAVVFTRHINKWSKMRNYDSIQQHLSRRPSTGTPCWSSVVTWSELCIISFQAWTHPATRQANVLPALGIKLRRDLSCLEFIIHDGWNCALKTLLYTGVCATQPRPPHTHTHTPWWKNEMPWCFLSFVFNVCCRSVCWAAQQRLGLRNK